MTDNEYWEARRKSNNRGLVYSVLVAVVAVMAQVLVLR